MLKFNKRSDYLPYVPAHIIGLYQEGGELAMSEDQMAQEQPQEDPMSEIMGMAQQALEANDGEMALQVCQALLQIMSQQEGQ
jgi:hypothetical protein